MAVSGSSGLGIALGFWNWERLNIWPAGAPKLPSNVLSRKEKMLNKEDLTFIIHDLSLVMEQLFFTPGSYPFD